MSNGLLSSGAGFGGWDTTPIQNNNNNNNITNIDTLFEDEFENEKKKKTDTAYINPFSIDCESQPNEVNQVFDLLFDTKANTNSNNNDAFYSFDFGVEKSEQKEISKGNDVVKQSSDSYSSHSSDDDITDSSDDDEDDHKNSNNKLKISPPTKQSQRTKKRRKTKTQNELAFEALDTKMFDPELINKVPINKAQKSASKPKGKHKKRNTEPVNIHSLRQKQLKEEGLIKKEKSNRYNVLPELHRGTALLKYGRRGYPHFRQFNLTFDNEHLRWFSSKKKLQQSSINVGSINEILTGQHTKEFRRIAWNTLTPASFSIIYQNKKKSLNLVAKSVDEMKMWVQSLRKLRDLKRNGQILKKLDLLYVEVDFRDRNRPQSRDHSGNFLRSHETKERQVDPMLQRKLIDDIGSLRKQFIEISREANNPIVQSTKEYESIEQILSELEERIEELDHEVRNTRNTKIAENDVWRTRIDLESLREKIKVINKQHKAKYKNSKRRWSVF